MSPEEIAQRYAPVIIQPTDSQHDFLRRVDGGNQYRQVFRAPTGHRHRYGNRFDRRYATLRHDLADNLIMRQVGSLQNPIDAFTGWRRDGQAVAPCIPEE